MIVGLSHACFVVSDLDRALRFYGDALGLKLAFELKVPEAGLEGVYLHVGGRTFIELFKGEPAPSQPNASYKHICLEVDDMESTVAALREKGADVSEVKLGQDGSYQAWLTDPDGNRVELHQFTPQSLQLAALGGAQG